MVGQYHANMVNLDNVVVDGFVKKCLIFSFEDLHPFFFLKKNYLFLCFLLHNLHVSRLDSQFQPRS